MADKNQDYDLEALKALVERDPGCPEFPALAEVLRRSGLAAESRTVSERGLGEAPSRMAGQVSLGLALLDLDDIAGARRALSPILDSLLEPHRLERTDDDEHEEASPLPLHEPEQAAFEDDVEDDEIAAAFETAEAERDQMISVNDMAERALLDHVPLAASDEDDNDDPYDVEMSATYSTPTMANLLEQQGDREAADSIRQALHVNAPVGDPVAPVTAEEPLDAAEAPDVTAAPVEADGEDEPARLRIVSTLETWLHNIQRSRT